ncbi:MAG: SOS response-associated peptidase family protein, partial [Terriglobales bacterium]
MLAELHHQGLGQSGMKALGPDPVDLLFHLGNRGHRTLSATRESVSQYSRIAPEQGGETSVAHACEGPRKLADTTTFAIITTSPNALMKPIHPRMPLILKKEDEARWLNPDIEDLDQLK